MTRFNYSKLLGKIIEKCGTRTEFAHRMGLSERSVSLKLNGKTGFGQDDMDKACEILEIPLSDVHLYFFAK